MKRERDRIRNLLLRLESEPQGFLEVGGLLSASDDERADEYHLKLMADEGLVVEANEAVWRLSALGHDAVEALETSAFWAKLKAAGPKEAYDLLKGTTSSLAVTSISKLMGWG